MTDVMDRLRAADPEPDCPQPPIDLLWAKLDEQERRGRGRGSSVRGKARRVGDLLMASLAIAVVAGIAAVALTLRHGNGGSHPAGASRAMLVEYEAIGVFTPARYSGASFSSQHTISKVWVSGSRGHSLATDTYVPREGGFVHEIAVNGNVEENYQGGPATRTRVTRGSCVELVVCAPGIPSDPVATLQRLRAAGVFRPAGYVTLDQRRLASYLAVGSPRVRAFVDPKTGVPVRIVVTYGRQPAPESPTDTIVISNYHQTPLTASNARLLMMHPRPLCSRPACSSGRVTKLPTRIAPGTGRLRQGSVVAQVNLSAPVLSSHAPAGIARETRTRGQYGITVTALRMKANTKHDSYALWLYSSPAHSKLLGFINPAVGRDATSSPPACSQRTPPHIARS